MALALVAGCAPATASPSASGLGATESQPIASTNLALQTPAPTPPPRPAKSAALKGKGSKAGPNVVLEGDYVLKTKVALKRGCKWKMFLDGLDKEPIDSVSTNTAGTHSLETDEIGLALAAYRIRVMSTRCGAWSVSLQAK